MFFSYEDTPRMTPKALDVRVTPQRSPTPPLQQDDVEGNVAARALNPLIQETKFLKATTAIRGIQCVFALVCLEMLHQLGVVE